MEVLVRRILFSSVFLQATLFDGSLFVVEYVTSNGFWIYFLLPQFKSNPFRASVLSP